MTVAPALGNPFEDARSKKEAVAAFAGAEDLLVKKDANGLRGLYESWKTNYNIEYPDTEDAQRFHNFVASVRRIIGNNRDACTAHWSGLNALSALSDAEFKARFTTTLQRQDTPAATTAERPPRRALLQSKLPAYKNWVAEGKVTKVKNQGGCGGCWAFAGISAMESRVLIALNQTNTTNAIDLSEQQVVDCARATPSFPYSFGCGGGQLEDPYRYAALGFSAPEALYPYVAKTNTCRIVNATAARVKLSGTGFTALPINSATVFKTALQTSPLSIAFYASDRTFRDYKASQPGRPALAACTTPPCGNPWMVDHAVLLVGYNATESSWYIKNSWGATWGEKGFFRMFMKPDGTQGTCQMYTWGVQPTAPAYPAPLARPAGVLTMLDRSGGGPSGTQPRRG
ncbi:hypothetical protein N2152v2_004153 [Parachlorella kessleri]